MILTATSRTSRCYDLTAMVDRLRNQSGNISLEERELYEIAGRL